MRTKNLILILLLAVSAFAFFRWQVDIEVTSGGVGNYLTFGCDSAATDGFDILLDIPYLPTPGAYGYFPLNDSLYPGYNMLGTDLREPTQDTIIWDVLLSGGFGFSLTWDSSELPDSGDFHIGAFNLDSLPEYHVDEWHDMRSIDSIGIDVVGGRISVTGAPISGIEEHIASPRQNRIIISPNPFNSSCQIQTPNECTAIGIYDVYGGQVKVLRPEDGEITWDGRSSGGMESPSGVYYFKLLDSGIPATKAVMLK